MATDAPLLTTEVVDENLLIKKVNKEMDIGLLPQCIGMEASAVNKLLKKRRYHYCPELNGILIRFGRVKFLADTGRIIDDQPLIFWKVAADLYVFNVTVGCFLKVQASRISKQYIGGFLVNCIDVIIRFQEEHRQLIETELLTEGKLSVGDDITFKVVAFSPSQKYIEGVIDGDVLRHLALLQ